MEAESGLLDQADSWDRCINCDGRGFYLIDNDMIELPQGYRNMQTVQICQDCKGSGLSDD